MTSAGSSLDRRQLLTVAMLTLAMGIAVTVSWFGFASRIESYALDPASVFRPSRLTVYSVQFLLVGALLFWLAHGRLRAQTSRQLAMLVTAAWIGEGIVLTVIGAPLVANELDPEIAWYYWLVATAGPFQPAAAFAGGWLGQRHARGVSPPVDDGTAAPASSNRAGDEIGRDLR